ncbi:hypothetical protein C0Q70_15811 [Pomacea canaliculata]|uniref:Laminin G domain-containing protein n=1 Tax=Pomacea canaliculata TaxID=400727 RepID=A0A2T7NVW0_POMCA|nr:hypothetical protein C0Q70_15811 [Pomacea canaliculata]
MRRACLVLAVAGWTSIFHLQIAALPADASGEMRADLGHGGAAGGTTPDEVTVILEANATLSTRPPYTSLTELIRMTPTSSRFVITESGGTRCEYAANDLRIPPECPDYRNHGNQSGKYEQRVNEKWIVRDCNLAVSGLVWNQTMCRCEWGPDGDASLLDFDRSTPCDTMLNVTFEDGMIDDAKSSFLELTSGSTVALRHYTSREGKEAFDWHHVSLIYEDGTLLFRVDNHPCIISNDFSGEVEKTACPLTIGADPLEKESRYIGYLDNLVVARYCRRFVEQAMVPDDADNETESQDLVKKRNKRRGTKTTTSDKPTNAPATQAPEETGETEKGQQGKLGDVMNALQ